MSKVPSWLLALFVFMFCFPIALYVIVVAYNSFIFDIECSQHLKRAADASSIELAQKELSSAITYAEKHRLTTGYTTIFPGIWGDIPSADIGFWYNNLLSAQAELAKVTPQTQAYETTNILMKLRETLLDHNGENGDSVTLPSGISRFPNNGMYFAFLMFSLFCLFIATIFGLMFLHNVTDG